MKPKFLTNALAVLLLGNLFIFQISAVFAAPGDLDTTFAGTGKTLCGFGYNRDIARAVVVQADGKLIVAGESDDRLNKDFSVVRYNTDGSADTSFGTVGEVITPVGSLDDFATSVRVQTDGKIVVAGYSSVAAGIADFAVVRYNTDGSLDTSFGSGGKVITPVGTSRDQGHAMRLQTDGKIVVAGFSYNGTNYDFAVVRYNSDGTLDTSFSGDGKATTTIGTGHDEGNALAIQSDGKIVVAGYSSNNTSGTDADFAVVRYNSNGSLDTSFDGDGKVSTPVGTGNDEGNALAIQFTKIVVAGSSSAPGGSDFAVVRYNPDGSLDTSFDGDGKVTTPVGTGTDVGYAVGLQATGPTTSDILVAGRGSEDFAVVRYNFNGSLDTVFDSDGKVTTPIGSSFDGGLAMATQTNGKFVVAGYSLSNITDYNFAVVRYNSNGSLDASFDGDGKRTEDIGSLGSTAKSVATQPDGKIVVAGFCDDGTDNDFAVARFNSDGSFDPSFDFDGRVTTLLMGGKANAVAIQTDGKIVVAGSIVNGATENFAIVRYNSNGSLDSSFSGGTVFPQIGTGDNEANAVVIQQDGKILVAGFSRSGINRDFALVRYNSNGALDASFDADGKVITDFGTNFDEGNAMAIQTDGRIVVAGTVDSAFAAVRYNPDGSLDTSFNFDGKVTTPVVTGSSGSSCNAMEIQSDGKIVVAGFAGNLSQGDFALVRYNSDGSLDNSFDGDGIATPPISGGRDVGNAMAIQSDGRIIVAGYSFNGTNNEFAVVRYNTNGSLDDSYGDGGKVFVNFGNGGNLFGYGMALDSNGRAIVVGDSNGVFGVARLLGGQCGYELSPTSQFFTTAGGSGSINVTTSPFCNWSATASDIWIIITSADSGAGNGVVTYEVRENLTASARQGSINISGSDHVIVQDGGLGEDCGYSISPAFETFPASGGSATINVTAADRCAWQAVASAYWITITSLDVGISNGTVSYAVAPNRGPGRKGTITIGGQVLAVKQKQG